LFSIVAKACYGWVTSYIFETSLIFVDASDAKRT